MAAVTRSGGRVVQSGPFRGLRYVRAGSWGEDMPAKLLGSYEAELHDEIEALVATAYDLVVNVGCAEGYYAVGLALRLPRAVVFAFDIDARARYLCRRLAQRNGVSDRVRIAGECTPAVLNDIAVGRPLIVVDCEGCERQLLRPALAPRLLAADLVVELHDFVDPGISAAIVDSFEATHDIVLVDSAERDPEPYAALAQLSMADRAEALSEHRPGPMQWAVLRAKRPKA